MTNGPEIFNCFNLKLTFTAEEQEEAYETDSMKMH